MPTVPMMIRDRLLKSIRVLHTLAIVILSLNSATVNTKKSSKWMQATTIAPVSGLNRITIPSATECDEKMNEKFLFHLFQCHGKSGRGSSFFSSVCSVPPCSETEGFRMEILFPARDCRIELGSVCEFLYLKVCRAWVMKQRKKMKKSSVYNALRYPSRSVDPHPSLRDRTHPLLRTQYPVILLYIMECHKKLRRSHLIESN